MDVERVQKLLYSASSMAEEARRAFLDRECRDDPEVRREVEELLEIHDRADDFLEEGVLTLVTADDEPLPQWPVDRVGPYRLERLIGRGGMGAVYLGERDDDEYRRQVAIKVMRSGVADPAAKARFRYERQVLAGLEHPHIARLYDGATGEDGRPYLVMEYIDGKPLDIYAREHDLNLKDRIRLFRKVCDAVAFAHRNLLVHRDLKPSNILVTEDGTPKLLDFGIAKSLVADEAAVATAPGGRALTPAYASPEQVDGKPVTTASDVYSLGVVLFELLTDARPYPLDSDSSGLALARAIADVDPIRPSEAEGLSPERRRQLQGDLDAIILKALRKEPDQRYTSVAELSEDLRRYLDCEPVEAHRDTAVYRLRKFVRRNRWGVTATTALVLGAVAFVVVTVIQSRILAAERDRAELERDRVLETLTLYKEMFKVSDPERSRGKEVTARQILDNGAETVRASADDPWIQATAFSTIAEVYVSLGIFEKAEPLHREALELRREMGSDVGLSLYQLGELEWGRRNYEAAEQLYRESLGYLQEGTVDHARSLRGIGLTLVWQGQHDEAKARLRQALVVLGQYFAADDDEILRTKFGLGRSARDQGDYEQAETLLSEVAQARRPRGAGPALGRSLAELGDVRRLQGQFEEARALLEEALLMLRKSMGADNSYVAEALGKLVPVLLGLKDYAAAEVAITEALQILPEDHPGRGTTLHNLAYLLTNQAKLVEADRVAREALEQQLKVFGEKHENVAAILCSLGRIAFRRGDFEAARKEFDACAAIYPEKDPRLIFPWISIGRSVEILDGCTSAVKWYRNALGVGKEALGQDHPQMKEARELLDSCRG